jgi:8-oxo-dGTP pyrophosphatase MutT (NUDIX family)
MSRTWKPNVTVAAVCEKDGKFLLVEEKGYEGVVLNQPAGHLEAGESLLEAVVRETLEETAHRFTPEFLVGVYVWQYGKGSDVSQTTYMRFTFAGTAGQHEPDRALDTGIVRAVWLTRDEIQRESGRHRTPVVMRCVDDFLAGRRYPLELIAHVP